MWKDEKADYLRRNRNYAKLLDGDDAEVPTPRSQNRGRTQDRQFGEDDPERQAYLDRRRRLKELERQKLTKGKNGLHASSSREEDSKPIEQNRVYGGNRSVVTSSVSRENKKLPERSSFGSFFGRSELVVAKRVVDEARERQASKVAAAKAAREAREAERDVRLKAETKKSAASFSAGKATRESRPPPKPAKPDDKSSERARKLKEARDYSFLTDDSPLPASKVAEREGRASAMPGARRQDAAQGRANDHSRRETPSEGPKSTSGSARFNGSTTSSRPFQSQSKSSPRQGNDRYPSERSSIQTTSIVRSSTKESYSKVTSTGPGGPESRKGKDVRDASLVREAAVRETSRVRDPGAGSMASARNKSIASPALDRRSSQIANGQSLQVTGRNSTQPPARKAPLQSDRLPSRAPERQPARVPERHPARAPERQPARASERQPARAPERQPARNPERQPAGAPDRRPTQSTGRLPSLGKNTDSVMAKGSKGGRPVMTQGLKKGAPTSATARREVGNDEPRRQGLTSQKPPSKVASRPTLSNYNRARYTQDPRRGVTGQKRARESSSEEDERPSSRNRLPVVRVNSIRPARKRASPIKDDDDSFIDDDDDPGNVSSMIHSIMGYNPNKYSGNDDFDDRNMEVGFRAIQAEERRSAREARLEDERELALIEEEERAERLRKMKKKRDR